MGYLRDEAPRRSFGWGALPWLLLAVLTVAGLSFLRTTRFAEQATMQSYRALLAQKAGPDAVDCGDTLMPRDARGFLRNPCITEALAQDLPFMASFSWDDFGHGYYTWWGIARDGKSGAWQVRYTPDAYEGHRQRAQPELDLTRCRAVTVPETFESPLRFCLPLDPVTGERGFSASLALFRSWLDALSGSKAQRCEDQLLSRRERAPLSACFKDALASASPFQATLRLRGFEGEHWAGYVRDPAGNYWMLELLPQHDFESAAGGMLTEMHVHACSTLKPTEPLSAMSFCVPSGR